MSRELLKSILETKHPLYEKWLPIWERNETGLYGGDSTIDEFLVPFHWEKRAAAKGNDNSHFDERKKTAVYINFPAAVAHTMVGSLDRSAPKPGKGVQFGSLGNVDDEGSAAYKLWNSADKRDGTGLSFPSFFSAANRRAMATGHRWMFCESYPKQPDIPNQPTKQQERERNLRPYLIEWSPTAVPNWYIDGEGIAFFYVVSKVVKPVEKDGKIEMKEVNEYYLHVRAGYTVFDGVESVVGGLPSQGMYITVDQDFNVVQERTGIYQNTGGRIPAGLFFYEESKGAPKLPAISRSGLSEVVRLSASYLNLSSAGDNDAIEGGSRLVFLLGSDSATHNLVADQLDLGGKVVSVPKADGEGPNPGIYDLAANSAHAPINSRLDRRVEEMNTLAADEVRLAPEASGAARDRQFKDTKSPRLAMMAQNRAKIETMMLQFTEMRWTGNPTPKASSTWKTDFDLKPLLESIRDALNLVVSAGAVSPTLVSELVERALQDLGLTDDFSADDAVETIKQEVFASLSAEIQGRDVQNNPPGIGGAE